MAGKFASLVGRRLRRKSPGAPKPLPVVTPTVTGKGAGGLFPLGSLGGGVGKFGSASPKVRRVPKTGTLPNKKRLSKRARRTAKKTTNVS